MGRLIPNQKMKMGWYKVPQSIFDYAPSAIDPVLMDMGIKGGDELKVPTSQLVRFECDARTIFLLSSFMDMTGAAVDKIIEESL